MEEPQLNSIKASGIKEMLYFRKDSTDFDTFKYVFHKKEYRLPTLTFQPKWIIDGGANVGYTSVYFAEQFPNAKIMAVESEPSNVEVMKENIRNYDQIKLLHAGLWNKNTFLKVKDVGLGEWGMMVEETERAEQGSFKAVTIDSIAANFGMEEIDILKLNVEGAEKELFSQGYESWLSKVKILIIELHDRMKPGCSRAFYKAIRPYNFATFKRGANVILYKKGCFKQKR
ncbi:FkbM family methyltransferase [Pseudalkalibacillus salsuginis]|uniref:FkbM family methyltransferase n=1 Tax=Pseudalkalibacillus salsuginis TaxID=2910972 RepID=UPI001F01291E|nr:FkbM family methyltransferase [Pseudalkalibacillus salsuginis]MCF6410794.1 FkbM family methyltransferase [Pseudalkalibacillus salsuginis]